MLRDQWRLVQGKELYDIRADAEQKNDLAARQAEVVTQLREHYERWWAGIEPGLHTFETISVGSAKENPVMLSAMDWLAHEGLDVQKAITRCEKVVIGKIHGYCLAGGLELALCCDLLYATESAKIGTTEINMGILPGWGGTARLPRSMPIFRAREVVYSGRKDYTAREMYARLIAAPPLCLCNGEPLHMNSSYLR